MDNTTCFEVNIKNGVAHLNMNRPDQFNSMTRLFWKELPEIIKMIQICPMDLPQKLKKFLHLHDDNYFFLAIGLFLKAIRASTGLYTWNSCKQRAHP